MFMIQLKNLMDTYLENIHKNLDLSTIQNVKRYDEIFTNYHNLLQTKGSSEAEEFLAFHMWELDQDFFLYFNAFSLELERKGLVEASKIMIDLGKGFSEKLKDYRVLRSESLAKNAGQVASQLISQYKTTK